MADALGIPAADVAISRRCAHCGHPTHGRPTITGNDQISFSLSHSGGFAVIVIGDDGARLGVDVEELRPRRRLDALAARVLNDEEYAAWFAIGAADEQLRAFLRGGRPRRRT